MMKIAGSSLPNMGFAMTASNSNKTFLPVSPASFIYSHFRHVAGTPAPEGTRGVAITKLKVLDVLIEQLAQMKKQPEAGLDSAPSDKQLDAMIEKYEGQIRTARAANTVMPYAPVPSAPAGVLFNLAA